MRSNNDDSAWQELIKDVQKLPQKETVEKTRKVILKVTPKISPNCVYRGELLSELEPGQTDNVDHHTARRFKKGEFKIEAELDLHGYTETKAFEAVCAFIKQSYLRQRRCIAIITGKGLHQNDEDDIFASRGVLKERVPQWLNLPDVRPLILAISHPRHQQGGSGVIWILLRRHRVKKPLW